MSIQVGRTDRLQAAAALAGQRRLFCRCQWARRRALRALPVRGEYTRLGREWDAAGACTIRGRRTETKGVGGYDAKGRMGATCNPMEAHCAISQGATPMPDHESPRSARPSSRRPPPPASESSLTERGGGGEERRGDASLRPLRRLLGGEVAGGSASEPSAGDSWSSFDLLRLADRGMLRLRLELRGCNHCVDERALSAGARCVPVQQHGAKCGGGGTRMRPAPAALPFLPTAKNCDIR
jgi:hypothetical protein